MNIDMYEFGLDNALTKAVEILRGAIGKKVSKNYKDIQISEAIGVINTVNDMVYISNPEEEK